MLEVEHDRYYNLSANFYVPAHLKHFVDGGADLAQNFPLVYEKGTN